MPIVHVLLMAFQPQAAPEEVDRVLKQLQALQTDCLHPTTKKPYIKSQVGGARISPEQTAGGFTHSFVMEFETEEDFKYYSEKDPAHMAVLSTVTPILAKVIGFDFTPGKF